MTQLKPDSTMPDNTPVALVTGAAKRIGAQICQTLHATGFNIVLHYHQSQQSALALAKELNNRRPQSCIAHQADLTSRLELNTLAQTASKHWQRLDLLVNNASRFYATPLAQANEQAWDELLGSNLQGAFFLSQQLASTLAAQQGSIVNIVDIYAQAPLKNYSIYCIAKAGLLAMTRSLALELAPHVRVNAVAPGAILWPEQADNESTELQKKIIERTALARAGNPSDIANTVLFLTQSPFITGQILSVDGGRLTC